MPYRSTNPPPPPPPLLLLLLFPLALQPTMGFGLSNNVLPFLPIYHQLSPSSHSQNLKISFYFLFPSFPKSSSSSHPFQFLNKNLFKHPILLQITNLSFTLLSILLSSINTYTNIKIIFLNFPHNLNLYNLALKNYKKNFSSFLHLQ